MQFQIYTYKLLNYTSKELKKSQNNFQCDLIKKTIDSDDNEVKMEELCGAIELHKIWVFV